MIEKILGVFIYFDQYQSKNKGMVPTMLICNNKLDMLVKSSNLPRLQVYLNTVNNKNDFRNTIWFGIPMSQKSRWIGKTGYVNSIMAAGDDMNYDIEEEYNICNVNLNFNGNSKNLEIVLNKNAAI